MTLIEIILRMALGAMFVLSGFMKTIDLKEFSKIVMQFGIIPRKLNKMFSYSLPFAEIIVGLALILNFNTFYFLIIALLMIISYTIGTSIALHEKKKMDNCGCYGIIVKAPLTWKKIAENAIYLIIIIYLLI